MITGLRYRTPHDLPDLWLESQNGKLIAVTWWVANSDFVVNAENTNDEVLNQTVSQLDAYFAGQAVTFDVPWDISAGTAFQQTVWQALATIRHGTTLSYAELAQRIARPTAIRALANAVANNPLNVILPCHRVITSSGKLGGYLGRCRLVEVKRALLNLEGVQLD